MTRGAPCRWAVPLAATAVLLGAAGCSPKADEAAQAPSAPAASVPAAAPPQVQGYAGAAQEEARKRAEAQEAAVKAREAAGK